MAHGELEERRAAGELGRNKGRSNVCDQLRKVRLESSNDWGIGGGDGAVTNRGCQEYVAVARAEVEWVGAHADPGKDIRSVQLPKTYVKTTNFDIKFVVSEFCRAFEFLDHC